MRWDVFVQVEPKESNIVFAHTVESDYADEAIEKAISLTKGKIVGIQHIYKKT